MKIKNLWSIMMMLVLMTGIVITMASCGDDDDDVVIPTKTPNPTPTPNSDSNPDLGPDSDPGSDPGSEEVCHNILGVGNYSWEINSVGDIISYKEGNNTYKVTNNGKTFTLDESIDDETVKTIFTWTLNSKGLATKLEASYVESWTGYKWEVKETHTFTYNGNLLSSISTTYTDIENDEGDRYKISGKSKATFKYNNGQLTEYAENWSETDDGDTDSGEFLTEFSYNNNIANPFKQYTPNVVKAISWIGYELTYYAIIPYIYTGRLGEASSFLPTSISGMNSLSCSYTFDKYNRISKADNEYYSYQPSQRSKSYSNVIKERSHRISHIRGKKQRNIAIQKNNRDGFSIR